MKQGPFRTRVGADVGVLRDDDRALAGVEHARPGQSVTLLPDPAVLLVDQVVRPGRLRVLAAVAAE